MPDPRECFRIAKVDSVAAPQAYQFHAAVSASDPHIWPRTDAQIQEYVQDRCLFGAWRESTGELVGIVCAILDESATPAQYEVGGLTVARTYRGRGIASVLVRFAVAHTMAFERPWKATRKPKFAVVAHVHKENPDPRGVLDRIGFVHSKAMFIPGDVAPPSMKRDSAGNVSGDELKFTAHALENLSRWFNQEFTGHLRGGDEVVFDVGEATLADLQAVLRSTSGESPD